MIRRFHREIQTPRQPLPVMEADPEVGLTQAQAEARLTAGWGNDPGEGPSKSEGQIVRENVLTFFNLVFWCWRPCW